MKKCKNIKWIKLLLMTVMVILLWGSTGYASPMKLPEGLTEAYGETVSIFVTVTEETKGYKKADETSEVAAQFNKEQKLFMVQRLEDGWCEVMYNGESVFIKEQYVQEIPPDEALAEEIKELEAMRAAEADMDVRLRKDALRSRIAGLIIAALIAGIFIAGIVAVLRSSDEHRSNKTKTFPFNRKDLKNIFIKKER